MRKKINLILSKKDYYKKELIFKYFRFITISLGFFVLVLILIMVNTGFGLNSDLEVVQKEKELILSELIKKKEEQVQLSYVQEKDTLVNNAILNDVNFVPYYNELKSYLPIASGSASIDSIDFDNKQNFKLTISFFDYEKFNSFLAYLEDKKFLDIFEKLVLDSFSISEEKNNNYKLVLIGIIKKK